MPRLSIVLVLLCCCISVPSLAEEQKSTAAGHYLFVWAGDYALQGNDFLAVIDADPASASYGRLMTTLATDQKTVRVHHTEYTMPESAMLFANDHDAGRTFIFDVREPLQPKIVTSFTDMAGYMHPHSYVRLPNGNVLATFQHAHAAQKSGGLVEIDDRGKVIRSASSADPALPSALLMPYGLVVVPELDRVVSTNSSMHLDDIFSGSTYQVWRLSDLKLLKTTYLDVGANHYGQISPQEPRLGPDGSVFVRITQVQTPAPQSQLVHTFPGNWCGVPTIVGHYLVQSVPAIQGLIVLDIANPATPTEVSRLTLSDVYRPHWTAWDAKAQRLIVTSSNSPADRLYLLKLDPATGALSIDYAFRDQDGRTGFSFAERAWPHGWKGAGIPHGAVASR
jgi:hypothetical protein